MIQIKSVAFGNNWFYSSFINAINNAFEYNHIIVFILLDHRQKANKYKLINWSYMKYVDILMKSTYKIFIYYLEFLQIKNYHDLTFLILPIVIKYICISIIRTHIRREIYIHFSYCCRRHLKTSWKFTIILNTLHMLTYK